MTLAWTPELIAAQGWRPLPEGRPCDFCGLPAAYGTGGPGMVAACRACITLDACAGCGAPLLVSGDCADNCDAYTQWAAGGEHRNRHALLPVPDADCPVCHGTAGGPCPKCPGGPDGETCRVCGGQIQRVDAPLPAYAAPAPWWFHTSHAEAERCPGAGPVLPR
jgi:hypothetical protein